MFKKERKYYALIDAYKQNWFENIETKIERGILTISGHRSDFDYWYSIHLIDKGDCWRVIERFYENWGCDDLRDIFYLDEDYGLLDPSARWSSEKKSGKRILVAKYNACDDGVQFIQHIRRIRELLEVDDDYLGWAELD